MSNYPDTLKIEWVTVAALSDLTRSLCSSRGWAPRPPKIMIPLCPILFSLNADSPEKARVADPKSATSIGSPLRNLANFSSLGCYGAWPLRGGNSA